ncbi:MAG TPA: hypothetical protein VLM43_02320 [Desulfobacterales bacterium]|nr:hypothetical protein [Desulfobacterales bacterium]
MHTCEYRFDESKVTFYMRDTGFLVPIAIPIAVPIAIGINRRKIGNNDTWVLTHSASPFYSWIHLFQSAQAMLLAIGAGKRRWVLGVGL